MEKNTKYKKKEKWNLKISDLINILDQYRKNWYEFVEIESENWFSKWSDIYNYWIENEKKVILNIWTFSYYE